jgi:hypothetical protein
MVNGVIRGRFAMKDDLGERLLARVMGWTPQQFNEERVHLQILASCKYDSYEQYRPGARFIMSLGLWLRTFKTLPERESAYKFILSRLIFISNREMLHLVITSYPYHIRARVLKRVAEESGISLHPAHRIATSDAFKKANRQCLYLGLSDGARCGSFRRGNSRDIGNEQVVATYQISQEKAASLLNDLRKSRQESPNDPKASRFNTLVFLDDFNGSGATLYRLEKGGPNGKLPKILKEITDPNCSLGSILDREKLLVLFIYYVSTAEALENTRAVIEGIAKPPWIDVQIDAVQVIPKLAKITKTKDDEMCKLVEHAEYYDNDASKDEHLLKGGVDNARYGFAACSLPLVLGHNTPNNSLFLLWSTDDYNIRGLFPRVPRHRPE